MQRKMNYAEATTFLEGMEEALGKGDSPVKTPLMNTFLKTQETVTEQLNKLEKNFKTHVIRDKEGNYAKKDPNSNIQGPLSYKFSNEEKFLKEANKLENQKLSIDIESVKKDRKVFTNFAELSLDEFLEFSSTVSTHTAFLLKEYFIEK